MQLWKQLSDGTSIFRNQRDGGADMILGGPANPTALSPRYMTNAVAKVPLAALDTGGGVLSWQNLTGGSIVVIRLDLNVTTKSTAASTVSAGTTVVSATTLSANLIDGLDVGTAAGQFSNLKNPGTLGKADQLLAAAGWVTISRASGACAGLVGFAYIHYHPL